MVVNQSKVHPFQVLVSNVDLHPYTVVRVRSRVDATPPKVDTTPAADEPLPSVGRCKLDPGLKALECATWFQNLILERITVLSI